MNNRSFSRRRFLGAGSCTLGLSSNALATAFQLGLANAAMTADNNNVDEYRALVCIFLHGGNDSYNMLIPASKEEHNLYTQTRGGLALHLNDKGNELLRACLLNNAVASRQFAVHPAIDELRHLYNNKKLAFLANVGTLVEPTSVKDFRRRSVKLPLSLFSHNDQRDQWHTAIPQSRGTSGWLGRASELIMDTKNELTISNMFSFDGNNLLQTGPSSAPFSVSATGAMALNNPVANLLLNQPQNSADSSLLGREFAQNSSRSIEKNRQFAQIISETPELTGPYPSSKLGQALKAAARTIAARKRLNSKRQTFFVQSTGWDTHQDMLTTHHKNLLDLSRSMAAFQQSLEALGVASNVTTFTASEFGRTLVSNGRGTDHGWGGHAIIMGGAVSGGNIMGSYPEALISGDSLDVGKNGRLLPTTANDLYFAELLRWYGLSDAQLFQSLPNLENFYERENLQLDLGIMKF